mmetsp:Transcript_542/g.741  ORF Transcript_542/g.741 Transcript_542/m.741 type:complete len:212 (+) Transcript_542:1035-1670(+)
MSILAWAQSSSSPSIPPKLDAPSRIALIVSPFCLPSLKISYHQRPLYTILMCKVSVVTSCKYSPQLSIFSNQKCSRCARVTLSTFNGPDPTPIQTTTTVKANKEPIVPMWWKSTMQDVFFFRISVAPRSGPSSTSNTPHCLVLKSPLDHLPILPPLKLPTLVESCLNSMTRPPTTLVVYIRSLQMLQLVSTSICALVTTTFPIAGKRVPSL